MQSTIGSFPVLFTAYSSRSGIEFNIILLSNPPEYVNAAGQAGIIAGITRLQID